MKKTILTLSILATMAVATAPLLQTRAQEKGRFWVGGTVEVDNDNQIDTQKDNYFSISPEFGYGFSDRWAAGLRLNVDRTNRSMQYNDGTLSKSQSRSYHITPFARYTALRWRAFGVFVDGGLSYATGKQKDNTVLEGHDVSRGESHFDRVGIFVEPGVSFQLSPRIALMGRFNFLNVHYTNLQSDNKNGDEDIKHRETESFNAVLNSPFDPFNIGVGFTVSF